MLIELLRGCLRTFLRILCNLYLNDHYTDHVIQVQKSIGDYLFPEAVGMTWPEVQRSPEAISCSSLCSHSRYYLRNAWRNRCRLRAGRPVVQEDRRYTPYDWWRYSTFHLLWAPLSSTRVSKRSTFELEYYDGFRALDSEYSQLALSFSRSE